MSWSGFVGHKNSIYDIYKSNTSQWRGRSLSIKSLLNALADSSYYTKRGILIIADTVMLTFAVELLSGVGDIAEPVLQSIAPDVRRCQFDRLWGSLSNE